MRRTLGLATAFLFTVSSVSAAEFAPPNRDVVQAEGGVYKLDTSHANIIFGVSHLGFSMYVGRFDRFDATLDFKPTDLTKSALEVTIQTASVDVHNSELEAKLIDKDFFDSTAFPEAKFVATNIVQTTENKGRIVGNLTLKGITKPVTLDVIFNGHGVNPFSGGKMLGFSASGNFKRSDFGMSAYTPAVGDEVDLTIEVEFSKAPS